MAKRMKNLDRDREKKKSDKMEMLNACLNEGISTRRELAKLSGFTLIQLNQLFHKDRELYAKFCLIRRQMVDIATDNIMDILMDPKHPKNYDASKYIATNYKSDIDSSLESKDEDSIEVEVGGTENSRPVVIRFGKKNKEE
jgi:hypothetical protein